MLVVTYTENEMKNIMMISVLSLLAMTGCVRSLNPIYTDADVVQEPAVVGRWVDTDKEASMDIAASDDGIGYRVVYREGDDAPSQLLAHLTKIGDTLVANLTVDGESLSADGDLSKAHLVAVHSFYIIRLDEETLIIQTLQPDWLNEHLKAHPEAIAHQPGSGSNESPLLTASTEELRAFIAKVVNEPGALSDAVTWTRAPTTAPSIEPSVNTGAKTTAQEGR